MPSRKPTEGESRFDSWLATLPTGLDAWKQRLPTSLAEKLDFSVRSLARLERWLLDEFPDVAVAYSTDLAPVTDGAAAYLGEVVRRHVGGRWAIEADDRRHTYGLPHIACGTNRPVIPMQVVFNALERRSGEEFSRVLTRLSGHADSRRGSAR